MSKKQKRDPNSLPEFLRPKTAATSRVPAARTQKRAATSLQRPSTTGGPRAQSRMAAKKWRQEQFESPSPGSRREVELLGEWQNSVLAENLEMNEDPLEVVSNAQHWYSIAFNELIRQVSITSAERGRLLAVIWKRNLDLFTKIIELQKEERDYILNCHKERVKLLKTDLEFTKSRLELLQKAFNDEKEKMENANGRVDTRFDLLQQKIDKLATERERLLTEIAQKKAELGIPERTEHKHPPAHSSNYDQLLNKARAFQRSLQTKTLEDIKMLVDDAHHLIGPRVPLLNRATKTKAWVSHAISFIVSYLIKSLAQGNELREFKVEVYEALLYYFGSRKLTENALNDLIYNCESLFEAGSIRAGHFLRFYGVFDPFSPGTLLFYLYSLCVFKQETKGKFFPEIEVSNDPVGGIPSNLASSASKTVLTRLTTGRSLKFYTDRAESIISSSYNRFGGHPIAETDPLLDYFLSAYESELRKQEDSITDSFAKIPGKTIQRFDDFHSLMTTLDKRCPEQKSAASVRHILLENPRQPLSSDGVIKEIRRQKILAPVKFEKEEFEVDILPDDVIPFISDVFNDTDDLFNKALEASIQNDDDTTTKQLRSSRVKMEQVIDGRASGRVLESYTKEYFERLFLLNLPRFV